MRSLKLILVWLTSLKKKKQYFVQDLGGSVAVEKVVFDE